MRRPPRPRPSRSAGLPSPLRAEVGGAPLVLPPWLDRLSERWWGLTPRLRAVVVLVLVVLLAGASVARVTASPYGPPTTVLVATDDLAVGTELTGEDLRVVRWPAQLVPADARTEAAGTLTAPLPVGAVLTTGHVTQDGLAGLVGAGRAAVPLPAELVTALPVTTEVQVVASGPDGAGVVLAERAEVVADDGRSLWLAVPATAAADVAAAGLRGTVALTVLPADRP
jgi:hypothetical protein